MGQSSMPWRRLEDHPAASTPRKEKTLKPPPIAHFYEFLRRAPISKWRVVLVITGDGVLRELGYLVMIRHDHVDRLQSVVVTKHQYQDGAVIETEIGWAEILVLLGNYR